MAGIPWRFPSPASTLVLLCVSVCVLGHVTARDGPDSFVGRSIRMASAPGAGMLSLEWKQRL